MYYVMLAVSELQSVLAMVKLQKRIDEKKNLVIKNELTIKKVKRSVVRQLPRLIVL